jgi:hypothetical protein|tara:strand:- start:856 stop:1533 length:678 start_codon:yes stop_codon:yes gene_type:complete
MTTLLSLNLKKNSGVLYNNKKNLIIKFYINQKLSNKLKISNEFKGYTWYLREFNKTFKNKFLLKKKLNSLLLPTFKGEKFSSYKSAIYETTLIAKIINHYKLIWPLKKKVPFHGDLTFENVIFLKNNEVIFIDWEYFNDKEEWGLDLCHFLISLIVLPALHSYKSQIDSEELSLFNEYWKKTFYKKKFTYLKDPVSYLKKKFPNKDHFLFKISNKMKNQIYKSIL